MFDKPGYSPEQERRRLILSFWLADHAGLVGLVFPVAFFGGLSVIGYLFFWRAPAQPVEGHIRSIWYGEMRGGNSGLRAVVDFPGGTTVVRLPYPTPCQVGGPIRLLKTKRPWVNASAALDPCPAPGR